LDGRHVPAADGCLDLDLAFTPATNLLPIRRLALAPGAEAAAPAAWLTFPELALDRLEQTYRRSGAASYEYAAHGGSFRRTLWVTSAGFVSLYPGLWELA
ncbi:MAG TPA: putative glycolipid-binding domain-containing protein, partial [Thermoanaerobaculia bacterium]|nr:putative glycolipid-binding domain-containing protein [Thermoanaerobaculia bacterium]